MNEVVTIYDSRKQGLSTSYLQQYGEQKDKWIVKVISSSDEFIEESCLQPEKKVPLYNLITHLQIHMDGLIPDDATESYFTISRIKRVIAVKRRVR